MTGHAPPREPTDLAFLLSHVTHVLGTELAAALEEVGITPRAHCVLANAAAGERTQSELAALSGLDKTTMVVTTDLLERRGLAERRLSPTDRRARIIVPTPAGEALLARGRAIVDRVYADVLAALPEAERGPFVDALKRLATGRLASPHACEHPPRRRAPRAAP
jgi:MarR family transcriptional regulator, transcriptional regulator for hemolysin